MAAVGTDAADATERVPPLDKTNTSSCGGPYSVMAAVSTDTADAIRQLADVPP